MPSREALPPVKKQANSPPIRRFEPPKVKKVAATAHIEEKKKKENDIYQGIEWQEVEEKQAIRTGL